MAKKASVLHSTYVLDGVPQELTPAELLAAVTEDRSRVADGDEGGEQIVDETLDPVLGKLNLDRSRLDEYLGNVMVAEKQLPLAFADVYTRMRLAASLIDALWCRGSFRLGDLRLKALWKWNSAGVGSQAAFYRSVQSAADYIDALGLKFSAYSYSGTKERSEVNFKPQLAESDEDGDEMFVKQPFRSADPKFSCVRACPSAFVPDPQSWIVYIPFETSDYRLGGSLLAQTLGLGGGVPPQLDDADYFMDCFEVVRELVEDKVVLSGGTVRYGGLLKTVKQMTGGEVGASIDISGIMKAYQESDIVRILFSEVPGAIIQIRDMDFDYLDAELLLQDVAFFPLGHPVPGTSDVRVKASARSGIQTILDSLMQNAEGED